MQGGKACSPKGGGICSQVYIKRQLQYLELGREIWNNGIAQHGQLWIGLSALQKEFILRYINFSVWLVLAMILKKMWLCSMRMWYCCVPYDCTFVWRKKHCWKCPLTLLLKVVSESKRVHIASIDAHYYMVNYHCELSNEYIKAWWNMQWLWHYCYNIMNTWCNYYNKRNIVGVFENCGNS